MQRSKRLEARVRSLKKLGENKQGVRAHTTVFVIGVGSPFSTLPRPVATTLATEPPAQTRARRSPNSLWYMSVPQIVPADPSRGDCTATFEKLATNNLRASQSRCKLPSQQQAQQRCVTALSSSTTSASSSFAAPQTCALNSSQLMCPSLFVSSWSKACHRGLKPACPIRVPMFSPFTSSTSFTLVANSSLLTAPSSSATRLSKRCFSHWSAFSPAVMLHWSAFSAASTSAATSCLNSSASCCISCAMAAGSSSMDSLTSCATSMQSAFAAKPMNSSQDTNSLPCVAIM